MKKIMNSEYLIYSNKEENSNKYYILEVVNVNGYEYLEAKYGRLGKKPTIKQFDNTQLFYKKINEKIRKGYVKVDIEDILMADGNF